MASPTISSPPVEKDVEAPRVGLQDKFDSEMAEKGETESSAAAAAPLRRDDSLDQAAEEAEEAEEEEGEEEEEEEEEEVEDDNNIVEGIGGNDEAEDGIAGSESSTAAATKGKGKGKGKGGRASGSSAAATKAKGKGGKGAKAGAAKTPKGGAAEGSSAGARKQAKGGKAKTKSAASTATTSKTGRDAAGGSEGNGIGAGPSNTIFPLARVSRIVKVDREIEMTSKDAIWTIAVATELFIKHLTDSAYARARLEKKKTITYKELASASESQNEFFFLQDVIPQPIALNKAMEMRREIEEKNYMREAGLVEDEEDEEAEDNVDTLPLLNKDADGMESAKPAADQDDAGDIEMAEVAEEMLPPARHNGQAAVSNGSMS